MASVSVDGTVDGWTEVALLLRDCLRSSTRQRTIPSSTGGDEPVTERIEVDIPSDVQQVDGTGLVWNFLDEARDPTRITVGSIVVTGDDVDPVLTLVVSLTERPGGVKVRLDLLPGDTVEYAEALVRAHLLPA